MTSDQVLGWREGGVSGWVFVFLSLKCFPILKLRLYTDSELPMYPGSGIKVEWWVVGV